MAQQLIIQIAQQQSKKLGSSKTEKLFALAGYKNLSATAFGLFVNR
jgi:hypothetical protein